MRGDVIRIDAEHQSAAKVIVDRYLSRITESPSPFVFTVAGESGSGKSETGHAILEEVQRRGIAGYVFQQDDYFVLPPKSNDAKRREGIDWVGTQEVRLELLDRHVTEARNRASRITKPVIDYADDRIDQESVDLSTVSVVIAEGTYTSLLKEVDCRVFIDRNRLQTMESRAKRAREEMDPFIEQVLEIEHKIIAPHKDRADVVITNEYDVRFVAT